jgi:predicted metal-dependent phosphoesterase TrpH
MLWRINKLKGYHGVELNSRCLLDRFNKNAKLFAEKNNKVLIAGSDSHSPEEIGYAYTEVRAKTINEAIQKIKKGNCKAILKKRPLKQKIKPFAKSIIKG